MNTNNQIAKIQGILILLFVFIVIDLLAFIVQSDLAFIVTGILIYLAIRGKKLGMWS